MTEAREQRTRSISYWKLRIMLSVSELSRNLFHTLRNIPTVVDIMHRGSGCRWEIYVKLIVINLHLCTFNIYCVGVWYNIMIWKEYIIEEVKWSLVQILALFLFLFFSWLSGNFNQHHYLNTCVEVLTCNINPVAIVRQIWITTGVGGGTEHGGRGGGK